MRRTEDPGAYGGPSGLSTNAAMRGRKLPLYGLVLLALAASIGAALIAEHSAVHLCLIWLVVCAVGAVRPGAPARRLVCINAGFLLFVFGAAEIYFGLGPEIRAEGSALAGYTISDERLGYAPAKGHETTIQRYLDDELVYDVTYTIDEHGLRIAPPGPPGDDVPCILFFGGSYTFGEGLENDETLAWRVGIETGGRYRIHNFGYHGYGPHQMLAALELGVVDEVVTCEPRYVVYQGSPFHVPRAAGQSSWEKGGPRYEPTDDGRVEYRGQWSPDRFQYPDWLRPVLDASHVLTRLSTNAPPSGEVDFRRFMGILETTRDRIATRYPSAELIVVYWDAPGDPLLADMRARGFRVLPVSELIPDRAEHPERYRLHRHDGHPNALAMSTIARGLAATLQ
jgi:hypothetical protein